MLDDKRGSRFVDVIDCPVRPRREPLKKQEHRNGNGQPGGRGRQSQVNALGHPFSSPQPRLAGRAEGDDHADDRPQQPDQRGDAQYNQALSMQRAISVKQYLLNQGVDEKQVLTLALGEERSKHKEYEGTFFDRKVVIELGEEDPTLTAQR